MSKPALSLLRRVRLMALKDCFFFSLALAARSEKLPKLEVRFFGPSKK